jgi:hypothetical protein
MAILNALEMNVTSFLAFVAFAVRLDGKPVYLVV